MKVGIAGLATTLVVSGGVGLSGLGLLATAHADSHSFTFQSPSGDIVCQLSTRSDSVGGVFCDIGAYTAPPYAPQCDHDYQVLGYRFSLDEGGAPVSHCQDDTIIPGSRPDNRGLATLGYGKTASAGTITCDSEPTGMTCTDTSTSHFFRVSSDTYQMG